jgi:hypothetical protein
MMISTIIWMWTLAFIIDFGMDRYILVPRGFVYKLMPGDCLCDWSGLMGDNILSMQRCWLVEDIVSS